MADYRQIHTKCWRKDEWFLDLPPLDKLLFIYLFSNEAASVSGLYEMLPPKTVAFETGLEREYIEDALMRFEADGKIARSNGWIWVKNLRKYNGTNSPTVKKRIANDLNDMPDCELKTQYIGYYDGIDMVSVPHREHEQEHEQEQEQEQDIPPSAGANAPETPTESTKKPVSPPKKEKPPALTPNAQEFMRLMDSKRLNTSQRESLLALDAEYPENFLQCAKWVADKNPGLGRGIAMMKTALPDWGKKKKIKRKGDGKGAPDEPAGFAGIRQWMAEEGIAAQ